MKQILEKRKEKMIIAASIMILFGILIPNSQCRAATLYWPVPGHKSLSQGYHDGKAIDISDGSIAGANVVAAIGGTVTHKFVCGTQHLGQTSDCNGFGTGLVIAGDDGRIYQYAHMQANSIPASISTGTYVNAGQQIGKVGTTGNSSGNHLHFGISVGNYWNESGINPENEAYFSNNPIGCLDTAEGRTNAVFVSGWAFDSDAVSQAVDIHVYIGGPAGPDVECHKIFANKKRNDVNNAYGVSGYHGFEEEIPTSMSGNQKVYVYAINIGNGENQLIGTKTVNISQAYKPQGRTELIQGDAGFITVEGWAFDLDDISKPVEIHVYIGGPAGSGVECHKITANQYRNDVNNVYGVGSYHGFKAEIPTLMLGIQEVYVYAIDIGNKENPLLASGTVTITCNHLFENYIANNNGTHSATCDNCGNVKVSNCSYNKLVTEPTCNKVGYTTYTCKDCGYSYTEDYVSCIAHSFTYYISDNNATIGVDGTKTAYCDYGCGKTDTIIDEGSAWITEQTGTGGSGVANSGGEESEKLMGGTILVIPSQKCKVTVTSSATTNPTVSYTKSTNTTAKTITIPDTVKVDGITYKVTSIASNALANNKNLTKVTVGKNVTSIGKNAFKNCKKLKSVTLKATSLNTIGSNAFYGDKNLKTITIKSSKLTSKSIGKNAFKGTNKNLTIKVPNKKVKDYSKFMKKKGNKNVKVKK